MRLARLRQAALRLANESGEEVVVGFTAEPLECSWTGARRAPRQRTPSTGPPRRPGALA